MRSAALCLRACLLAAALASGPSHAALEFHSDAVCIDNGTVQDGLAGGLAVPSASCSYSVDRSGLNRRVGTAAADAQAIAGARSVGVDVSVDATLATAFPTVFGANASAAARIDDIFIMTGTLPLGTPVSNGLMHINAVATGLIRLDTSGAATLNTQAFLQYAIAVGAGSAVKTELVMLGDLEPGAVRTINVPFVIPAVPFIAGLPISVSMSARAELVGELENDGAVDARIQFGNSLDWLGITNVTDAGGTPLASFAAISVDTGVDWGAVAAVPEPAQWLLLACGLGIVLLARGRLPRAG
jgi:hypothetical protein